MQSQRCAAVQCMFYVAPPRFHRGKGRLRSTLATCKGQGSLLVIESQAKVTEEYKKSCGKLAGDEALVETRIHRHSGGAGGSGP